MRFECKDLTAGYGRLSILFDVTAEFHAETVTSIIGPNGAGKSTLLKALYGLLRVSGGDVLIDNESIGTNFKAENMVKLGIGYVPQLANVFPSLSVRENLEIGTYAVKGGDMERVLELFPDLRPAMKKAAGKLSGGQRTMVAIGRALMSDPKVVLIDEPTAGLAPQMAVSLWNHLRTLASAGVSVVVVEQNVRLALDYSDDVYLLASGRKKLYDKASELAKREDLEQLFMEAEVGVNA